jgi:hypothetical protein
MRARDQPAIAAIRSTLAAIDNASAVQPKADTDRNLAIERIPSGIGATEVERRALTEDEIVRIVETEIADRAAAATDYENAGRTERADRLRAEAAVLSAILENRAGD